MKTICPKCGEPRACKIWAKCHCGFQFEQPVGPQPSVREAFAEDATQRKKTGKPKEAFPLPRELREKVGALISFVAWTIFFMNVCRGKGALSSMVLGAFMTYFSFMVGFGIEQKSRRFRLLLLAGFTFLMALAWIIADRVFSGSGGRIPSMLEGHDFATALGFHWAVWLAWFTPYLLGLFLTEMVQNRRKGRPALAPL